MPNSGGSGPLEDFPLLLDNGEAVIETTPIIEHLQAHHPGPNLRFLTASSAAASGSSTVSSTSTSRAICSPR